MMVIVLRGRRGAPLLLGTGLLALKSLDLVYLTVLLGRNPALVQGSSHKERASSRMTLLKVPQ